MEVLRENRPGAHLETDTHAHRHTQMHAQWFFYLPASNQPCNNKPDAFMGLDGSAKVQ